MTPIDFIVVVVALLSITIFGYLLKGKSDQSTDEFIVGNRKMPFWLAGLSMIATNLNASTPLSDSRKMRTDGIAGLWFSWQGVIVGGLSVIWFDRLWRRSGITTAIELYAIRYRSWQGSAARIYDVGVLAIFNGCIWSALGLVGMKKLCGVLFEFPAAVSLLGLSIPTDWIIVITVTALALIYSTASGVNGVVWTDFFELIVTLACTYVLFFIIYRAVGWNVGLRDKILALPDGGHQLLYLWPEFGPAFLVLLFVQPLVSLGAFNPGVQRMLCVKDEREVVKTYLFNTVINHAIKPWPYLIAGLAGIFLVSDATLLRDFAPIVTSAGETVPDYEMMYPSLIRTYLPVGLTGLMLSGFLFAFMSSVDTNIHTSASIFVNDLYRPFLRKSETQRHYVNVARLFMVLQTIDAVILGILVNDILFLFIFAITVHNADGLLKMLRFIWWRINGTGEFVAKLTGLLMVILVFSPIGNAAVQTLGEGMGQTTNDAFYAIRVLMVVGASTLAGLIAVFLTPPEPMEALQIFYRRVRPYGWWGPVAAACPGEGHNDSIPLLFAMTFAALGVPFGALFAAIGLLLALYPMMFVGIGVCVVSMVVMWHGMNIIAPVGMTNADGRPPEFPAEANA